MKDAAPSVGECARNPDDVDYVSTDVDYIALGSTGHCATRRGLVAGSYTRDVQWLRRKDLSIK